MKPVGKATIPQTDSGACPLVIIALGSNLGNARENVLLAMDRLERLSVAPLLRSSLWVTTPVDCPPGSPAFVNAVVALRPRPAESPESLLQRLQQIEREFGRTPKKIHNEARPLDLDLIAFGDHQRSSPRLVLPHSRARARRFVLAPLCELLPEHVLPGEVETVRQLLEKLPADPAMRRTG